MKRSCMLFVQKLAACCLCGAQTACETIFKYRHDAHNLEHLLVTVFAYDLVNISVEHK